MADSSTGFHSAGSITVTLLELGERTKVTASLTHLKHSLDLLDQRCYNYNYCTSIGISLSLMRMCMTYMIHNFIGYQLACVP